jgi:ribosomal protein S12 methylthiotransferase accessory factor
LDASVAVVKALEELAHTRRYSQQIKSKLPPVQSANGWEDVVDQMDHLNVAADHSSRGRMSLAFDSPKRLAFSEIASFRAASPEEELSEAVKRVTSTGHRVLTADLTSADVYSLGLRVHRVLIPGYHPLFMGHSIRALGGRRLREVPQKLGYSGLTADAPDNDAPHPYP